MKEYYKLKSKCCDSGVTMVKPEDIKNDFFIQRLAFKCNKCNKECNTIKEKIEDEKR